MNISDEELKTIETARKYGLIPGTDKCRVFQYFEAGFSTTEVYYLTEKYLMVNTKNTRRTLGNNIRRYYYIWKTAQSPTEKISNE